MRFFRWLRRLSPLPADPPVQDHVTLETLINRLLILEKVHGPDIRVALVGEWAGEMYAVSVDYHKIYGEELLMFWGESSRKSPIGSYHNGWR